MKIALMGFTFSNPNKGCEALTYSFINLLCKYDINNLEIYTFGYAEIGNIQNEFPDIKFHFIRHRFKSIIYWNKLKNMFDNMDCIFDITFGDGFSDIYGKKWNIITNFAKQMAINSKSPFVLLPQTYGPYYSRLLKHWAYSIISKADISFSRDVLSANQVNSVLGNKVVTATDIAFALPYNREKYIISNNGKTIFGINISALLWGEGHPSTIKLKMNYKSYCRKLVNSILSIGNVEIHFIPHVIDKVNYFSPENDYRCCKDLHNEFPCTILAPEFNSAIDAKSYISNMDIFIGARMHSTIAAFSSGVATIPVSYSIKFEGLFGALNYPFLISAINMTDDEGLKKTLEYIGEIDLIRSRQKEALNEIDEKLIKVYDYIASLIK